MKPVQLYGVAAALLLVAAAMALAAFLGKHKRNNDIERYRNLRELVIERSAELSRGGGCGKIVAEAFQQIEDVQAGSSCSLAHNPPTQRISPPLVWSAR